MKTITIETQSIHGLISADDDSLDIPEFGFASDSEPLEATGPTFDPLFAATDREDPGYPIDEVEYLNELPDEHCKWDPIAGFVVA